MPAVSPGGLRFFWHTSIRSEVLLAARRPGVEPRIDVLGPVSDRSRNLQKARSLMQQPPPSDCRDGYTQHLCDLTFVQKVSQFVWKRCHTVLSRVASCHPDRRNATSRFAGVNSGRVSEVRYLREKSTSAG